MRVFLISFLLSFSTYSHCQTIKGTVSDLITGKPVPYASIGSKKNPSRGTVANAEGNFRITLDDVKSDILVISHMGYVTKEISPERKPLNVKLTQRSFELKEVVITPTDPLLDTLRKAFSRIATNYPGSGTLIRGIYRETNQQLPDSVFDYFSEALVDVYKTSYRNQQWGAVKIVEGGIVDNRSDSTDILFYGGAFVAHRRDFVKERIEFINPKYFDRYLTQCLILPTSIELILSR